MTYAIQTTICYRTDIPGVGETIKFVDWIEDLTLDLIKSDLLETIGKISTINKLTKITFEILGKTLDESEK